MSTINLPGDIDGDWAFIGYIALVAIGALSLCYLDEKKSTNPTVSATVYPLCFPDESIPWNTLNRIEFFSDPLGLGLTRLIPSFLRRSNKGSVETKGKNADDIHLALSTKLHAYLGYAVLTTMGFIREAVWTISLKKSSHHKEAWNSIWWKEFLPSTCTAGLRSVGAVRSRRHPRAK